MQSFPPVDATRLQAQTDAAVAVITEAFDKWRGSELALSFNGGKDCTVLLHLLGKLDRLRGLRVVFFDTEHGFPEVTAFMKEMEAYYGFKTECLGGFRPGLQQLVDDGIKAVFLGTRRTDPHGSTLSAFAPTTPGWPPVIRVNPILDWSYADVWAYLCGNSLPYCVLYDRGYTSLGSVETTHPNPELKSTDTGSGVAFRPAFLLTDDALERCGRSSPATHPPHKPSPPDVRSSDSSSSSASSY